MSVVINTNYAATLAANNLSSSSSSLQRSLNRLASGSKIINPQDDAAGLAVSMKLSATARRQNAASANLGNAISFLQTQDGALQVAGKVLSRIGELKTLYNDPTKNADDLANYQAEFAQLQAQLTSLNEEEFNHQPLFGATDLAVQTTAEPNGSAISFGGASLTSAGSSLTDNFANLGNWTDASTGGGTATVSGNTLTLAKNGGTGKITSQQTFSGPTVIEFDVSGTVEIGLGGTGLLTSTSGSTVSMRIELDGLGNYDVFQGNSPVFSGLTGAPTGASSVYFSTTIGGPSGTVQNVSVSSSTTTDVGNVATATNLGSLTLDSVTDAIQHISSLRASNGAEQSRLQFASEVLSVNKANIEAANSRITDVDVAEESTSLARYNILVQSGTAMLTQANQSAQMALRLLG